jgi:hypothetical protein
VPGAVVFVLVMVFVVPVAVMLAGALWSAAFGWLESADADAPAASRSSDP